MFAIDFVREDGSLAGSLDGTFTSVTQAQAAATSFRLRKPWRYSDCQALVIDVEPNQGDDDV